MRYTFKSENEDFEYPEGATVTVEFSTDNLSDVLAQFGYFLKGSGFVIDGEVDVVNNNDGWTEGFDDEEDEEGGWLGGSDISLSVPGCAAMPFDTMATSVEQNDEIVIDLGDKK